MGGWDGGDGRRMGAKRREQEVEFIKNLEQGGGEVGTSRQYGLKGGRAECIICRIYQKP